MEYEITYPKILDVLSSISNKFPIMMSEIKNEEKTDIIKTISILNRRFPNVLGRAVFFLRIVDSIAYGNADHKARSSGCHSTEAPRLHTNLCSDHRRSRSSGFHAEIHCRTHSGSDRSSCYFSPYFICKVGA